MYLLLAFFLIFLELIPEAIRLKGQTKTAGVIEWFYRVGVTLFAYFWITGTIDTPWGLDYTQNLWKIIVAFIFVRFGMFDPCFNLFAGESINYIGSTKWCDILLGKILTKLKFPVNHFIFIRFIFFVWGTLWLLYGNTNRI